MGKKGKRSGFGGSGGGGNARGGGGGGPRGASGLVVVNPMLLQSMGGNKSVHPAKGPAPTKGKKTTAKPTPPPAKKANDLNTKKRKQREAVETQDDEPTAKKQHQQPTQQKHIPGESAVAPLFQLQVARDDQCLAGLYWVLLTRDEKRSAVVAIRNAHATLSPPLLAHAFKSLGFQALALHSKMTPGQRKQNVERFIEQSRHAGSDKCVLVTNDHWLHLAACGTADLIAMGSSFMGKSTVDTKFARVVVVHSEGTVPARADVYEKPLTTAAMAQLQARLKIAMQIAGTLQRLQGTTGASDAAETKWVAKLSKGADLGSDDDEDSKTKNKKTGPLKPEEQRLRALTEKLLVLLAHTLTDESAGRSSSTTKPVSDDASGKLALLGLAMKSAAMGDGERLSAQTQWLDSAVASSFGGDWHGAIRHGASKDTASLAVRHTVCACLNGGSKKKGSYLRQWRPNQQPADLDAWGGAYGKACGHNEVVLHHVRPFFPQEVLNSRVCSMRQPAPGNQGFDGCLEFLRLACLDGQTSMTVWDAEHFLFFSKRGRVTSVAKLQLLPLPLAGLQTLETSLRQWTLACHGRTPPVLLLEAIRLCCRLGLADDVARKSHLGDAKLMRRVLAFAVGGSSRVWKQITKMPRPLAHELLYDSVGYPN